MKELAALATTHCPAGGTFGPNHGALALMGLALVMLGRGQYSVDRRLYGRERIELTR